jgi:hypothetical protein
MIRSACVGSVMLVVLSLGPAMRGRQTVPAGGQDFAARARRIHAETIGIDSHIDTLQRVLNGKEDISRRTGKGHAARTFSARRRSKRPAGTLPRAPLSIQG